MKWVKWVEGQIRAYICSDLRKEDIMQELMDMDEDIAAPVSRLDDMPRSPRLPSSPVERLAEYREESQARLKEKLQSIENQTKQMKKALNGLDTIERRAIEMSYMSVSINQDVDIAKCLNLSREAFWGVKFKALAVIYETLQGSPMNCDIDQLVQQEQQKYKKILRMNGEKPERNQPYQPLAFFNKEQVIPPTFVPWHELPGFEKVAHLR